MTREEALKRLRPMESELRASGLSALYLFGSTARGDAGPKSDVDLMCDIDDQKRLDLMGFAGLCIEIEKAMDVEVDLVPRRSMRPRIRARAEQDMVQVF
jgi:uncharacterized protein